MSTKSSANPQKSSQDFQEDKSPNPFLFESKESVQNQFSKTNLDPDSAEAKQKYEKLLGQNNENEIEDLIQDKENRV